MKSGNIPLCRENGIWFMAVFLLFPAMLYAQREKTLYDVVILGGRIMDPERRMDMTENVGIADGTIRAITAKPIAGTIVINARGLVVAPGFIDLLSYDPVEPGVWNKIADGVTTALAMHGGTAFPDRWYSVMEERKPPINYGASFFYTEARRKFQQNIYAPVAARDIPRLVSIAEQALRGGCLGVSFSLEYVPGITRDEIVPLMHLAARFDVPVFFHVRYSDMEAPGTNIDALHEVLAYARETGAAIHIDHINSTGGTFSMARSLAILDSARAAGIDVTTCIYPYTFWGTYLNSARFDRGWQQRFRITYSDLQLAGSNERLTPESFTTYRRQGKLAVAYAIPEEDLRVALRSPYVMIGSDAILEPGFNNHPRASGTFSRTIAVYSREQKTLSLMDALARMTILPARRMERSCPAMKKKGRLSIGADADIVIFDPERIRDQSTVEHPESFSTGISYVLVSGQMASDMQGPTKECRAGRPIRRGQ
jgi:N-acyl-D-aspartate/D-glutamate deacylase